MTNKCIAWIKLTISAADRPIVDEALGEQAEGFWGRCPTEPDTEEIIHLGGASEGEHDAITQALKDNGAPYIFEHDVDQCAVPHFYGEAIAFAHGEECVVPTRGDRVVLRVLQAGPDPVQETEVRRYFQLAEEARAEMVRRAKAGDESPKEKADKILAGTISGYEEESKAIVDRSSFAALIKVARELCGMPLDTPKKAAALQLVFDGLKEKLKEITE